jgi:ATP citrate (pro-S)-lyase
LPRADLVLSI